MSKKYTPQPTLPRVPFVPKYDPSSEQRNIFQNIKYGDENLHIDAGAGSGKTTTCLWSMVVERNPSTAFLAFAKDIANAITAQAPHHVTVGTAHAFANRAINDRFGSRVWEMKEHGWVSKVGSILADYDWINPKKMRGVPKGIARTVSRNAERLVDMMKITLTNPKDITGIYKIIDRYNLEFKVGTQKEDDLLPQVIEILPAVMNECLGRTEYIDFNDMVWYVSQYDLPIRQYDMVYVDECQDLSNMLRDLVKRMSSERIVTVGDEFQAIYGFAGANSDSINLIKQEFSSMELPLMTCYRCGHKIIEYVNRIMPKIKAHENNCQGEVNFYGREDNDKEVFNIQDVEDGTMVLCRRNSGLVRPCFELLKNNRKAIIRGKNIGDGLVAIVETVASGAGSGITKFMDKLEVWQEDKIAALNERDNPPQAMIDQVNDSADAIRAFAEGCKAQTHYDIINKIEEIFTDSKTEGVTLSSIHKAKGLEADRVCILQAHKIRISNDKMTPEDHIQERNAEYVALTRAKQRLDLIYED